MPFFDQCLLKKHHFFLEFFFSLKNVAEGVFVPSSEVCFYYFELLLENIHDIVASYGGLSPLALYVLHERWVLCPEGFEFERSVVGLFQIGEVDLHWPVIRASYRQNVGLHVDILQQDGF